MTLEEVIQLTKQALEKVNPDKRVYSEFRFTVEQVKQLLEWLEDYKRLRSESSWISCEERMPEEWKDVIVCFSDSDDVMIAYHLDYWQESRECIPLNNVTHWMPLPSKPDKEVTE